MENKKKKTVKKKIEEKPKVKRKRRRKKKKGFTLIELLAVIVILGLLMAIAIPSVTRYITESRKKTLTTTLNNYIGALVNEVNDLSYTFTGMNTIYAVPIECISLERGGTSPFGEWYQANDNYWAYVLIQYDDTNSKYVYGFTFKDSAGYGLYPITQSKINERGKQIKTGLDLNKPVSGDITSLTTLANWENSGFEVDSTTDFKVLEATSEGELGDGKETCTLCQKGKNYAQVEEEKKEREKLIPKLLVTRIKNDNILITSNPIFNSTAGVGYPEYFTSNESGLYTSTKTNSGQPTYYFRGAVLNNNVKFAGFDWKIIRINENDTVRLILNSNVSSTQWYTSYRSYSYMYYSNSKLKSVVDEWYNNNIVKQEKDLYVSVEMFCEQAKVKWSKDWGSGKATMTAYNRGYTSDFKCSNDGNGKGILNSKVGLITYDEIIYAGDYISNSDFLTMSPAGFTDNSRAFIWNGSTSQITVTRADRSGNIRPVINLNANVLATGTGTSSDPYVVITE